MKNYFISSILKGSAKDIYLAALFSWLLNSGADICFLQETYSTQEVGNIWRKQWKGNMFLSHGSSHSRGVLVLVRDNLDFQLRSIKVDSQGRCFPRGFHSGITILSFKCLRS